MKAIIHMTLWLWLLIPMIIAIQITLDRQDNVYSSDSKFGFELVFDLIEGVQLVNISNSVSNNCSERNRFTYA